MLDMKTTVKFCAVAVGIFASALLMAQTIKSPEVHSDGTVTFRLQAPTAQKVEVRLEDASG
jgi:hypothetical protein